MNKIQRMTKPRKVLKTNGQVIDAFGGTNKCALRWDVTPGAVSQWRSEGIPSGWHLRMDYELQKLGKIVDHVSLGWR